MWGFQANQNMGNGHANFFSGTIYKQRSQKLNTPQPKIRGKKQKKRKISVEGLHTRFSSRLCPSTEKSSVSSLISTVSDLIGATSSSRDTERCGSTRPRVAEIIIQTRRCPYSIQTPDDGRQEAYRTRTRSHAICCQHCKNTVNYQQCKRLFRKTR